MRTKEEAERLRAEFAPTLAAHRRRRMAANLWIVAFGCSVAAPLLFAQQAAWWMAVPGAICLLGVLTATLLTPRLGCPGCRRNLREWGLGRYCPECGSQPLQPAGLLTAAHCPACKKSIRYKRRNSRQFVIRACTHCGLKLDEQGF